MSESENPGGFTVKDPDGEQPNALPRIDFSMFVLSLATSGMVHMGLGPSGEADPDSPANLPLAQQTIDSLELLQEKTRGNLSEEESHLLESVLYELRMNFVKVKAGSKG